MVAIVKSATENSNTNPSPRYLPVGPAKMVTKDVLVGVANGIREGDWINRWGGIEFCRSIQRVEWHIERKYPFIKMLKDLEL